MRQRLPNEIPIGALVLRRVRQSDADAFVAAIRSSLDSLRTWFPWASTEPSVEEQRSRLMSADRAFDDGTDFEFGLFDEAGELVGSLRVNPLAAKGHAGIGYWIRSDRRGRGLASSATAAATASTLEHLAEIDVVEIHMDQANAASVGVARRAGFELVKEIDREVTAPGHTGRGFVWELTRLSRT